ncbi:hypothetical protein [Arthrobacter methylotrophus]|uniref:hypothetical protein n=1 Tax=Arthrobacter methylotrophus TaxID=121291 RepID=UPI0031E9EE53
MPAGRSVESKRLPVLGGWDGLAEDEERAGVRPGTPILLSPDCQDNTGGGGDGNYSPRTALKFLASKGFRETYRENNILLLQKSQYAQDSESLATAAKN